MTKHDVVLGDVAVLVRGVSYRPSDLLTSGTNAVPLLRATNIGTGSLVLADVLNVPSALVREPQYLRRFDVVIAMSSGSRAAVGRLAQLRRDWVGCVGAFCGVLRAAPDAMDAEYLGYVLRSPQFRERIETYAVGIAIMNLSRERLLGFRFRLPSPAQQRAIAHILGTLDDKIELNRRMSETLEAMARALFKSWFVDFDPVRATADGRDPGLPKPLADLFPARLVDSELGEMPEGWEVSSIYRVADVVYGAPFVSAKFNTDRVGEPLIRIRDLTNESPGVWTPEVHPKGYKVRAGDVVVGMDGEFRAYLWGGAEGWLNQRVCVFVPKGRASAAFVRNSIMKPLAHVEATETATTVIHLGKGDIDRFRVVVPKDEPLAGFNEQCQPWYERIVAAKRESRNLVALRDSLLPKLVSGDLRVSEAAAHVEATA
ncbi:MAG: restriction endonuclease subunit S [Burkholderiales bacterium]|nr:restriction endonuclease subunit S [Burkholderiales bacterium]